MFRSLLQLLLFVSVSFAAPQSGGGSSSHAHAGDLQRLYERVLKPNYQKIAPLREYARERQRSYYLSAALALIVFVLFVKYFKLTGAVVALLMIAGGIWYLKTQTPAISPYKAKFAETILSPIAEACCGYRYHPGKITQAEIAESRLFGPAIKSFTAHEGLWVKDGVRFGYVEILFETQEENTSVEKHFKGFLIVVGNKCFKEVAADTDPLDPSLYSTLDLHAVKGYAKAFERLDAVVKACR